MFVDDTNDSRLLLCLERVMQVPALPPCCVYGGKWPRLRLAVGRTVCKDAPDGWLAYRN